MARPKKIKADEPIKLWFKKVANGNKSIYLIKRKFIDGKDTKQYECLNMYIIPANAPNSKEQNTETLRLANQIKTERILNHYKGEHALQTAREKKEKIIKLSSYIDTIAQKHLEKTNNKRGLFYNLNSLSYHLEQYKGKNITFNDVDKKFVLGFIAYLRTAKSAIVLKDGTTSTITQNTANKLYNLLKSTLEKAFTDEIINVNPCKRIAKADKPQAGQGKREYLTKNEVKRLIETNCNNDNLKRAFIFCCLTGIRFSDIRKIKFSDLKKDFTGNNTLEFKQQKTKEPIIIQISNEALKWIPETEGKTSTDYIFTLPKNESANVQLKRWCKAAGITKHITFHSSRHTAATLNLTLGTPIEVVSKLLGHSKIQTTQIYGKIIDEVQRAAVDKQDNIFG